MAARSIATGSVMVAVAVTEPDFGSDVARHQGHGDESRRPERRARMEDQRGQDVVHVRRPRRRAHAPRAHRSRSHEDAPRTLALRRPQAARRGPWLRVHPSGAAARSRAVRSTRSATAACTRTRWRSTAGGCPTTASIGGDAGLGRGFYLTMEGFENGRLQTAARAVGVMQAAYEAGRAVRAGSRRVRATSRRLSSSRR